MVQTVTSFALFGVRQINLCHVLENLNKLVAKYTEITTLSVTRTFEQHTEKCFANAGA